MRTRATHNKFRTAAAVMRGSASGADQDPNKPWTALAGTISQPSTYFRASQVGAHGEVRDE